MATTRLRKAFRYPEDDGDDSPTDGIDEEEQENLITQMRTEDAAKTAFYRKAFLALPALSVVLYLRPLVAPANFSEFLAAALAVTSLAASAFTLECIPLASAAAGSRAALGVLGGVDDGPVERFLPLLNVALCVVVWLEAVAAGEKVGAWEGCLPAVVLGVVFLVRWQLAPVDVEGLQRLRYGYKGA